MVQPILRTLIFLPLYARHHSCDSLTDSGCPVAAQPAPKSPAADARPPPLVCLEAVHEALLALLAGRPETHGLGLLALLVGLMVLETQLAVMLIDKTGELTSGPWPPSRWTASGAGAPT